METIITRLNSTFRYSYSFCDSQETYLLSLKFCWLGDCFTLLRKTSQFYERRWHIHCVS